MSGQSSRYAQAFQNSGIDPNSLTILVSAGGTREDVSRLLGADTSRIVDRANTDDDYCAFAFGDASGGIVAFEHSGYADVSDQVLTQLSTLGGASAITSYNIQGHERFGCARNGRLVFDDDEYKFVSKSKKENVPAELRPLFDSAWVDLEAPGGPNQVESTEFVALAMVEKFTGVAIETEVLARAIAQGYHPVEL